MTVRPAKTQISLGICPDRSVFAMHSFLHVDIEDWSDWADAQADLSLWGRTCHFVGFVMRRLIAEINQLFRDNQFPYTATYVILLPANWLPAMDE